MSLLGDFGDLLGDFLCLVMLTMLGDADKVLVVVTAVGDRIGWRGVSMLVLVVLRLWMAGEGGPPNRSVLKDMEKSAVGARVAVEEEP